MKTKEQLEAKIARSKARVEARNTRKAEAKLLQGVPMIVTKEEVEARIKAEKKPITRKKWKEIKVCQLVEAQSKTVKVMLRNFYSEELKSRRKAKREHLKALLKARKSKFNPQCISYFRNKVKQAEAQAKWNMMILHIKEANNFAKKQSIKDKAKYKASLVASKTPVKKDNKAKLAA